jgi:hypothetical protein
MAALDKKICQLCTFENPNFLEDCQMCSSVLPPMQHSVVFPQASSIAAIGKQRYQACTCTYRNADPTNPNCELCGKALQPIPDSIVTRSPPKVNLSQIAQLTRPCDVNNACGDCKNVIGTSLQCTTCTRFVRRNNNYITNYDFTLNLNGKIYENFDRWLIINAYVSGQPYIDTNVDGKMYRITFANCPSDIKTTNILFANELPK